MQIKFLGATQTVTGSKYLIQANGRKILVDCGLFQGYKELRLRNWAQLPIDPAKIDAVILTHAHIDHSGYLPLLIKNGFRGKIYCTPGTNDLCSVLLPDSGFLHEEDARRANKYGYSKHKPALPLYTQEDSRIALLHFNPLNFDKTYTLFDTIKLTFLPAGHIIGSSLVCIEHDNIKITFTGDLGRPHHPVMKPPATIDKTDYIVVESTYGNRLHDKTDPMVDLAEIITETAARGGSIIIPAFAVGRTQDVLYYLYQLIIHKKIPEIPIFLDSPMAQDVTNLLHRYENELNISSRVIDHFCKIAKYVRTSDESKQIDQYANPCIIISASGMAEGGRILHHLKSFLPDRRHSVIFTGYQDPGTRGDRLLRGEPEIKIHGEMIPVRAQIHTINSMSAHADYQEMLNWLGHLQSTPRRVFITHGDSASAESLKSKIIERFHWNCLIPEYLDTVSLDNP